MNDTSADHPVRVAYQTYLDNIERNRPSWDLLAAAYAMRGSEGPFALSDVYSLEIDARSGEHRWDAYESGSPRCWVMPTINDDEMAEYLEALLNG